MKNLFVVAFILTLSYSSAFAVTLSFPNEGDAMFTIKIPDNWNPDTNDDDVVEATSPKEHIRLSIWQIESEEGLNEWGKDVSEILKDRTKNISFSGKGEKVRQGGMDGYLFRGTALDAEDDHAIDFAALVLVSDDKYAVAYFELDAGALKKEIKKLNEILNSIERADGEKVFSTVLTAGGGTEPSTTFKCDTKTIRVALHPIAIKTGDQLKAVWTIEDAGDKVARNTELVTLTGSAVSDTEDFTFSISAKDGAQWHAGRYRIDLFVNDEHVETLNYEVVE